VVPEVRGAVEVAAEVAAEVAGKPVSAEPIPAIPSAQEGEQWDGAERQHPAEA